MIPDIPVTRVRGRNTASIVNVEATMEIPTSSVPWIAACLGFSPLSKCVVMFSNATMASSTTIPIAMERADIDMIFNVLPVANRYTRDASNEIGMVRTMISVALHLPRKTYTTSITRMNVMMMVSFRELILLMILSELSTTVSI